MNSKVIYVILAIVSASILAPWLVWHLTAGGSTFEGGRAYSRLFVTPVFFLGFLLLWFIDYKIGYKPTNKFLKYRNIAFLVIIIVGFIGFPNYVNNEIQEKKARIQNGYACKEDVKASYVGHIIETEYQRLKIRKTDSNGTEFKYSLLDLDDFDAYFYVGQKIAKKANETVFEVQLKDGSFRKFKIPCYQ